MQDAGVRGQGRIKGESGMPKGEEESVQSWELFRIPHSEIRNPHWSMIPHPAMRILHLLGLQLTATHVVLAHMPKVEDNAPRGSLAIRLPPGPPFPIWSQQGKNIIALLC